MRKFTRSIMFLSMLLLGATLATPCAIAQQGMGPYWPSFYGGYGAGYQYSAPGYSYGYRSGGTVYQWLPYYGPVQTYVPSYRYYSAPGYSYGYWGY